MAKPSGTALFLDGRKVTLTRYDHGGARFSIEDSDGRELVADTYSKQATDFLVAALTVTWPPRPIRLSTRRS